MSRFIVALAFSAAIAACTSEEVGPVDSGIGPCLDDDACALDEHCAEGVCVAGSGNACVAGLDTCGADSVCEVVEACGAARCHGNRCVPKACALAADCASGRCEAGVCGAPPSCLAGEVCPDGFDCRDGACVPAPELACVADEECARSELCVLGRCGAPRSCRASADCGPEERCLLGLCRDPCDDDVEDCGLGTCDVDRGECANICASDTSCRAGAICELFRCVAAECVQDEDCPEGGVATECAQEEREHGRCVDLVFCGADGACPRGRACDAATDWCAALTPCISDRTCAEDQYCQDSFCRPSVRCTGDSCADGFDCIGGRCVPAPCRGSADCAGREACIAGVCIPSPPPTTAMELRVLSRSTTLRPGDTYRLKAVALDARRAAIPETDFEWETSSSSVASVNTRGLVTAGATAGRAVVRARLATGTATLESAPVTITNLGAPEADVVRVAVRAEVGGAPIAGAVVQLDGAFGLRTTTTDGAGLARFESVPRDARFAVTAGHIAFDYVTVLDVGERALLLPLPATTSPRLATGFTGSVDLGGVRAIGEVGLSVSGASIPSPLFGFEPGMVLGGDPHYATGVGFTGASFTFEAPAAVTVVFQRNTSFPLKGTYYARTSPGLRVLWSIAGRTEFSVLRESQSGSGGVPNYANGILPRFQSCEYFVGPFLDFEAQPTVPDVTNVDGDYDTAELVPNWSSFPVFEVRPDTSPSLRVHVSIAPLPVITGGPANALLAVGGVLLPGVGFVPLGVDGTHVPLGAASNLTLALTPPRGGIESGEFVVIVSAIRFGSSFFAKPGASRMIVASRLPESVDFTDGWLDAPVGATYAPIAREVALGTTSSANMYRATFRADDGAWHVYGAGATGEVRLPVPPVPDGLVDRTEGAEILLDAVRLAPGFEVDALFRADGADVLRVDRNTRAFARAQVVTD